MYNKMVIGTRTYSKPSAPEELTVPASLVTPVVLLLNDTNIIWYRNRFGHKYT